MVSRKWTNIISESTGHDNAKSKSPSRTPPGSIPAYTNSPAQKSTSARKIQREVPIIDAATRLSTRSPIRSPARKSSPVRANRAELVLANEREMTLRLQNSRFSRLAQLQTQLESLTRAISLGLPANTPRSSRSQEHKPARYAITVSTRSPSRLSLIEIHRRQDAIRKELSEF